MLLLARGRSRVGTRGISVLHLNGSLSDESVTSVVASGFLACLAQQNARREMANNIKYTPDSFTLVERDLWHPELPRFCKATMNSSYRVLLGEGSPDDEAQIAPIRSLTAELLAADCIVISAPVWNHSVPYVLKQYMDCVVQPNMTYCNTTKQPFVSGKSVVLVTSAGGASTNVPEHESAYGLVKAVFGRMGYDRSHVITIEGLQAPELREARLDKALSDAEEVASHVATDATT
ncbi:hypothetical protein SDRG_06633 [Saprolegnia diclina VS20]|uniref:Flavodoxin-like fold domain-containing protein n=1 Tax=Saprolegnia diclina (strain VS20) TaxID=1156394 RepID=T0QDC0_SAPDV|nr:hypothetical protein SDRG_06633 [Saprolegnia diclina VS20]EQC35884.1 hypothetical protein SDRG_06633 [Saprolegnia diclina VS20]|eukprot:XP_008610646.1 hypothetical protein SDRG_06633 [Saprolegnia diclina VS20]